MTHGTDWSEVSTQTIGHYAVHAARYRDGTLDHDVAQNIDALLDAIEGPPPFEVLDLGCGPGRDLKRFVERGHRAVGLDGALPFVEMARAYSGCEVWQQDFLHLELPTGRFDGVFANATLFHVPSAALPDVLLRLHACLKPRGVLFASNPRGDNREGWNGVRYGAYYDLERWQAIVTAAGFEEIHHYFRPPGLPREQQPWLASVWRARA
jgi:SAM-dependent methyltransferase